MGRFLFAVWPYAGHLNPCMSLAGRLRERGHTIAFYTGAPGEATVSGEGYPRFPFDAVARYLGGLTRRDGTDDVALYQALTCRYSTVTDSNPIGRLFRVQRMLLEWTAGSIPAQLRDLRRIVREWRPDVIVTDPMMWAPHLVLHETGVLPVVPFSFYAGCFIPGSRLAPAGLGLSPGFGLGSASRNYLAATLMRGLTARIRATVNRLRQEENLGPMSGSVHEHSGKMPLYVVASTREFDYARRDLPRCVEYAGPCIWERPGLNLVAEPDSSGGVQSLPQAADADIIYVSEGSAQAGEPFLLRPAIEALARENVQVIATTGLHRSPEVLGAARISSNTVVRRWVSQMGVFARSSVVVTTGGSGTVRQALWFGVPVLVAPLEWDQAENAQRLVTCGAGIRISVSRCKAAAIGRLVRRLRTEPSFGANAGRIGETFRRAAASNTVLERLESLIGRTEKHHVHGKTAI